MNKPEPKDRLECSPDALRRMSFSSPPESRPSIDDTQPIDSDLVRQTEELAREVDDLLRKNRPAEDPDEQWGTDENEF